MSSYSNMTIEFSIRIGDILTAFDAAVKDMRKEVTFLLAIADPAITIPLERLDQKHPSHHFNGFPQAAELKNYLNSTPFLASRLWPETSPSSWRYGGPLASVEGDPDSWPELTQPNPLDASVPSIKILKHIRHALSHGNVYTRGLSEISQLVFLSWNTIQDKKYMYIVCSPSDFRQFLDNWLSLLKPIHLPSFVIPEEIPDA